MNIPENSEATGHKLAFGNYEQAKEWIGWRAPAYVADVPVDESRSKYYCTLAEDGNPSYWDDNWAQRYWGGLITAPGLLMTWVMPLQWDPAGKRESPMLAMKVPLPGDTIINTGTETEFFKPVYIGDRITVIDEVVDVSEEKTTRLGTGHFIITDGFFYNSRGELVGRNRNTLYRFKAHAGQNEDTP